MRLWGEFLQCCWNKARPKHFWLCFLLSRKTIMQLRVVVEKLLCFVQCCQAGTGDWTQTRLLRQGDTRTKWPLHHRQTHIHIHEEFRVSYSPTQEPGIEPTTSLLPSTVVLFRFRNIIPDWMGFFVPIPSWSGTQREGFSCPAWQEGSSGIHLRRCLLLVVVLPINLLWIGAEGVCAVCQ